MSILSFHLREKNYRHISSSEIDRNKLGFFCTVNLAMSQCNDDNNNNNNYYYYYCYYYYYYVCV